MIKRALVCVFALVMLSACGYRGALTLPEPPPEDNPQSQQKDAEKEDDQGGTR